MKRTSGGDAYKSRDVGAQWHDRRWSRVQPLEINSWGPVFKHKVSPRICFLHKALFQRDAFADDLQSLNGHFVCLRIEAGAFPLARPTFAEIPSQGFLPGLVLKDDRAGLALGLAIEHLLAPLP